MAFLFSLGSLGGHSSNGLGSSNSNDFGSLDLSSLLVNTSSGSSFGSSVGGSVGGGTGAIVGGILGSIFGSKLGNIKGFLQSGHFSCLGGQAYDNGSLRKWTKKLRDKIVSNDPEAILNFTSDALTFMHDDMDNHLRSYCSKQICRKLIEMYESTQALIKNKYDYEEYQGTSTFYVRKPCIYYRNLRLKGTSQHNPDGTRMTQEQYLALYGERLAREAVRLRRNIREYIAEQYYKDTGVRWVFTANSDGGYSLEATNQPRTQIPWLLLLLVGGGVYLVTKDKK